MLLDDRGGLRRSDSRDGCRVFPRPYGHPGGKYTQCHENQNTTAQLRPVVFGDCPHQQEERRNEQQRDRKMYDKRMQGAWIGRNVR